MEPAVHNYVSWEESVYESYCSYEETVTVAIMTLVGIQQEMSFS